MASGKVDVRLTKRTGKYRLRFYGVAPDQLETILNALRFARDEIDTEHDTVALEGMCILFMVNRVPEIKETAIPGEMK